jgi:hypothetical protein
MGLQATGYIVNARGVRPPPASPLMCSRLLGPRNTATPESVSLVVEANRPQGARTGFARLNLRSPPRRSLGNFLVAETSQPPVTG